MNGRRSRAANAEARRHKSAKRQIKHQHRFIEYNDEAGGLFAYEDRMTGMRYQGVMPPVLKAFVLREVWEDGVRVR
jgi:hypothetical protein